MRRIQLSGRERAVLKAIGFAEAIPGSAVAEHTNMPAEDLADIFNALLSAGYVESRPYREQISNEEMLTTEFEVNPSYVHELRASMKRSWA